MSNVTLLSDLKFNKENSIYESNKDESPTSKLPNQDKDKNTKITILSYVRFSKENSAFYGLKNVPYNWLKIDKNCDISSSNKSESY